MGHLAQSHSTDHGLEPAISACAASRPHGKRRVTLFALAIAAGLWLIAGCTDTNPAAAARDETLTLGLRVHLLESAQSESLTSTLSEADVELLLELVNGTWKQAGIEWRLDEIVRAEALNPGPFERVLVGLAQPTAVALAGVIPRDRLSNGGWDVFFIRNLFGGIGGIYFPQVPAVLQPDVDPLGVHGVEGALPRILAHELGHSLGLPHVPCTAEGNLMAAGCPIGDRTRLTTQQIRDARLQALQRNPFRGPNPDGVNYRDVGTRRLDGIDAAGAGEALPEGWTVRPVRGFGAPHSMVVRDPDQGKAIRFVADRQAAFFSLQLEERLDPTAGTLAWAWRVDKAVEGAELRVPHLDDSPARFFVVFGDRGLFARPRIIFYTWGNEEEVGTRWRSHVSDRFAIVVLRNREDPLGEWIDERRDLTADFRAVWGLQPSSVAAVGFMVDTDDSAQRAASLLGRVEWHGKQRDSVR